MPTSVMLALLNQATNGQQLLDILDTLTEDDSVEYNELNLETIEL